MVFPLPQSNLPKLPQLPAFPGPTSFGQPFPEMGGFNFQSGLDLSKVETSRGAGTQTPFNVLDVRSPLSSMLSQYGGLASGLSGAPLDLGRLNLSTNFMGPEAFNQGLKGGIDFFGNMGISQGLGNIALQRSAADSELGRTLGSVAGNEGLISVLKNLNLQKSQMAANPLISQAQRDTASRVEQQVNLQNQLTNLINQTKMQNLGFNQQSQLAELSSRIGQMQPMQNLLEILSGLQGQARGVSTAEDQILGRNFK